MITVIVLNLEQLGFIETHPNDEDGMTNSVGPDQSLVCTVFTDLSVSILRSFMVTDFTSKLHKQHLQLLFFALCDHVSCSPSTQIMKTNPSIVSIIVFCVN